MGVGFVEDDANGRKNRHVQDCVELGGKFVGFIEDESYAAVTEVENGCVALSGFGEDGIRLRACERHAFPFAVLGSRRG